jgi:Lrp/AsnC family transcriptional regulator, regulator for asnA, asnC and gidA
LLIAILNKWKFVIILPHYLTIIHIIGNMDEKLQIDELDKNILRLLMLDARISYLEIARANNVSGATIHLRMNKLEKMGIVKGARLIINPEKIGLGVCAFIGVFMEKGGQFPEALADLKEIHEVTECFYTTGSYSFFVRLYCRDTTHLLEVLTQKILRINGVQRTETFIAMEQSIERPIKI